MLEDRVVGVDGTAYPLALVHERALAHVRPAVLSAVRAPACVKKKTDREQRKPRLSAITNCTSQPQFQYCYVLTPLRTSRRAFERNIVKKNV